MPPDADSRDALVEMARAFSRGKVLCAAVHLGVPDALGDGPLTIAELAGRTKCDADGMKRFVRALVAFGIVEEVEAGSFALTDFGEPLRRAADSSVWASVVFWGDLLDDAWTYLADCVRAGGRHGAADARARTGSKSRWETAPDARAVFVGVFGQASSEDMAPFASAWDFSGCRVVADLGGGGGGLLRAILETNPGVRGILVDQRDAIEAAVIRFEERGLLDRCQLIALDLLVEAPAGADVYVMKAVLHGYEDEHAGRILRNVRSVNGPDDRLLLIEAVLPEHILAGDPLVDRAVLSDLNMLAVTSGRERSSDEWESLLVANGFDVRSITPIAGGEHHCLIEAVPR